MTQLRAKTEPKSFGQPIIKVENLTRRYHVGEVEVEALRGVDLIVNRGEFLAIMGASGSGKSSLMGIIGCLDRPTSGKYYFEGVDVAQLTEPELARMRGERLGFVFQSFNLLPRATAVENVALPLLYVRSAAGERLARARSALALVGLAGRERNRPSQLSGGEQQRVAIARALINNPSVVLADEPTGSLDMRTSHSIMETLGTFNRDFGITTIVITHDPEMATYAGRVLTLRDGRIVMDERKRKEVY